MTRFHDPYFLYRSSRSQEHFPRASGFTLVELLVAMVLLALLLFVLLRITTSTMEVSQASHARMQSGGDLRSALDRMSVDFSSAIRRGDLPPSFLKNDAGGVASNDAFSFFVTAEGYPAAADPAQNRGVSRISYRIRGGRLERGASAAGWENNGESPWAFPPGLGVDETHYDVMAERVFRLELDFLMNDGTLLNSPAPANWDEVRAVVVTLATINERALIRVGGNPEDLAALFLDPPVSGIRTGDQWSAQLNDPTLFPGGTPPALPVLQGLQVRQRVFQIHR